MRVSQPSSSPVSATRSQAIVRAARTWIRYAPTSLFKTWLWARTQWRPYRYVARTRHGVLMRGQSTDLVQGYVYYFGHWEPNLTAWLLERLPSIADRVFLDVGANVGYFSVLAASLSPSARVVAIEASPMIHRMLEDHVRLNRLSNVRSVCCAAVAEPGPVTLFHGSERNWGGTTTTAGIASDRVGVMVDGKRLCDVLTDDEVAGIRLVKIDVEGAEWSTLRGLLPVFPRLRDDVEFVIEVVPGLMPTDDVAGLFDLMESAGFNAYRRVNSYDVRDYLRPRAPQAPTRLRTRPVDGGDVIFSRVDAPTL